MNIEKTISEQAVSDILTPMLESQDRIVTEDVAPLFEQATGLDTPPASGTVTTTIEESRSVIRLIIRKAWTAPLTMLGGASVIGYITAAYTYLRNRLQGNETYGIPDRRSEISASSPLAANLALLNDRKIGGVPEAEDGMSLVHLLNDTSAITELTDDNVGWTMASNLLTRFANLESWQSNVGQIAFSVDLTSNMFSGGVKELDLPYVTRIENTLQSSYQVCYHGVFAFTELERVSLPKLNYINGCLFRGGTIPEEVELPELETATRGVLDRVSGVKRLICPKLKTCNGYSYFSNLIANCPDLVYAYLPSVENYGVYGTGDGAGSLQDMPKLEHLVIGRAPFISSSQYVRYALDNCPKLILLDIRGELNVNLYLDHWSPTLDSSNLQQFLSNFKTYIAERLADNGSGKTLTLSQSVFSEIWDSQGQPQVKGDGLDQLRADIHRIIRTDKQWAVNKA